MKINLRRAASPLIIVGFAMFLGVGTPVVAADSPPPPDGGPQQNGTCGGHACYFGTPYGSTGQPPSNDVPEPGWYILMAAGSLPMGMKLVRRRLFGACSMRIFRNNVTKRNIL